MKRNQKWKILRTVLELVKELQIKSKTVISWRSQKKRVGIFCTVYIVLSNFFDIFVLSQMYSALNTLFTYQKTLLYTLCCLFLKAVYK